jgi:hypothetical protein
MSFGNIVPCSRHTYLNHSYLHRTGSTPANTSATSSADSTVKSASGIVKPSELLARRRSVALNPVNAETKTETAAASPAQTEKQLKASPMASKPAPAETGKLRQCALYSCNTTPVQPTTVKHHLKGLY